MEEVRNRKSEHVKTFLGEKEKVRSQRREELCERARESL